MSANETAKLIDQDRCQFRLDGNSLLVVATEERHAKIDGQLHQLRSADFKLTVSNIIVISTKEPMTFESETLKPMLGVDSISSSFATLEAEEFESVKQALKADERMKTLSERTMVWTKGSDASVMIDESKFANSPLNETLAFLQNHKEPIMGVDLRMLSKIDGNVWTEIRITWHEIQSLRSPVSSNLGVQGESVMPALRTKFVDTAVETKSGQCFVLSQPCFGNEDKKQTEYISILVHVVSAFDLLSD
jgi:Flp pilus assembly secretin CpaC